MPKCPPDLLTKGGNNKCADCQATNPDWCSVKIGVFLCMNCAGVHRKLGTHISFVRSAKLDEWKEDQIEVVKAVGNDKAKAYYEHSCTDADRFQGPVALISADKIDPVQAKALEKWIRDKYEHKKYAPPGLDDPYVRVKRGEKLEDVGGGTRHSTDKGSKKDKKEKEREKERQKEEENQKKDKKKKKDKDRDQSPQQQQPPYQQQDMSGMTYPGGQPGQMYQDPNYGGQGPYGGQMPPGAEMYQGGMMAPQGMDPGMQNMMGPQGMMEPQNMAAGSYGANRDAERRAALQSIAQILGSPQNFGIYQQLLPPYGFNLQMAEFEPTALKRPKHGMMGTTPYSGNTTPFSTNLNMGGSQVPPSFGFNSTPGNMATMNPNGW